MDAERPTEVNEQNRRFAERCAAAAAADDVAARAERWRNVRFAEHARIGIELMRLAEIALRSRPTPYVKPPLTRGVVPRRHD